MAASGAGVAAEGQRACHLTAAGIAEVGTGPKAARAPEQHPQPRDRQPRRAHGAVMPRWCRSYRAVSACESAPSWACCAALRLFLAWVGTGKDLSIEQCTLALAA